MFQHIKNIFRRYSRLIILSLLLIIPSALLLIVKVVSGNIYEILSALFALIITFILIFFVPVYLNINLKRYFLLLSPFYFLIPAVIFVLFMYQEMPTRWIIYSVIHTDKSEASEFLYGLFFWKLLILVYPIAIIWSILKLKIIRLNVGKRLKLIFLFVIIFLPLCGYGFKSLQLKTLKIPIKKIAKTTFRDTPVSIINMIFIELSDKWNNEASKPQKCQAFSDNPTDLQETYVLIIGESSRYSNWGINGYYRNTSPNLSNLHGLITCHDVISPSFLTTKALKNTLTSASIADTLEHNSAINLLSVFKEVGFETWWITNQRYSGKKLRNIVYEADNIFALECRPYICYDEALLGKLDSALHSDAQKKLIVLHLMGSHYPYHKRYPDEFAEYIPYSKSNKKIFLNEKQRKNLINSYDNSILYTDFVVSSVIKRVDKQCNYSSVIYFSDHGETQFEEASDRFAQGFRAPVSSVYKVPFFIWTSKGYESENQEIIQNLKSNINCRFSLEDFLYTQTSMANINGEFQNHQKSIVSPEYEESPRYIKLETEVVEFDKIFK